MGWETGEDNCEAQEGRGSIKWEGTYTCVGAWAHSQAARVGLLTVLELLRLAAGRLSLFAF